MLPRVPAVALLVFAVPALAAAAPRHAFVTSVSGMGNLGDWADAGIFVGLDAGDQICRVRAATAGLDNAGSFRAWLSSDTVDAYCHVQGLTGTVADDCGGFSTGAGGPWFVGNSSFEYSGTLDQMVDEQVFYRSVVYDEFSQIVTGELSYWTGTFHYGNGSLTCGNWGSTSGSGTIGAANGTSVSWSYAGTASCGGNRRLLCLEPGASETPSVAWFPGAIAFVTSQSGSGNLGSWPAAEGETGLDAGDAICRNLAAAAHLPSPETFVAWLSTASVDAKDRIPISTAFRRIDGFPVATSKAVLSGTGVQRALSMDEQGRYLFNFVPTLTGTRVDGTGSGVDCNGWSSGASGQFATWGNPTLERTAEWTDDGDTFECNFPGAIYCFGGTVVLFWDGFDLTEDTSRWSSAVP